MSSNNLPSRTCRLIRRSFLVTALLLGMLGSSSQALAWGRCGHKVVGHVAQSLISPPTARAVSERLGGQSLAKASLWADNVRGLPEYQWTGPYHYINVDPSFDSVDSKRDCPQRGCVIKGIEDALNVLQAPSDDDRETSEALKFLLHYVGDLHQPLHVSNAADRGGNSIEVSFLGESTNLHSVWDTGMITEMRRRPLWKLTCRKLAQNLAKDLTPSSMEDVQAELLSWTNESLLLARSNAYPIPANNRIGAPYLEKNRSIIEDRLRLAGQRLAALLDTVFSEPE